MLDTIIYSNGLPIGIVCCEQKKNKRIWQYEEIQFAELIADCCTYRLMERKQAKLEIELEKLAFLDDLTQTNNRRYFFKTVPTIISLHKRENSPLSIAILDLDDFKNLNDTHGHTVGDAMLEHFAKVVTRTLRIEDVFCRYGGEEFIILFQNQSVKQAVVAIERTLQLVENSLLDFEDNTYSITFSAGITDVNLNEPINDSIKLADDALYKAKNLGKNRIEVIENK